MKVLIIIHDEGEWDDDTLASRMVDARVEAMEAEFNKNNVPVEVLRVLSDAYRDGLIERIRKLQAGKS